MDPADPDSIGKAPAFQFYARDFDSGTRALTAEEVGCYMRLLCHQWDKGYVPSDPNRLALIAGVSATRMRRVWSSIGGNFVTDPQNRGLVNARLEKERLKQIEYRRIQSDKGRASGASRRRTGDEPRFNPGSTPVRTGTPTEHEPGPQPEANSAYCSLQSADWSQKSTPTRGGVFRGERLGISKGQHAYLCRELGDASAYLLEWYPQWDAELVESGELFDTLEFCKRRAKEILQRQIRTGEAVFSPADPHSVDWLEECRTLHGGACGASLSRHEKRLEEDAEVSA